MLFDFSALKASNVYNSVYISVCSNFAFENLVKVSWIKTKKTFVLFF